MPNEPAEDRSVRGNTLQPHTVHAQNDVTIPDNEGGTISVSTLAQGIPSGGIIMWSGAINDIPDGWVLCDGTDGTPDLQDRFVAGAGAKYSPDDTGGEEQHTLTVDEMPSHTHDIATHEGDFGGFIESSNEFDQKSDATTKATGGDKAHENRPPYYALAFIMKE